MHVLYVIFTDLSVASGASRSVSIVRALADAGHHVDVVAAKTDIGVHPNINILAAGHDRYLPKKRLRLEVVRALGRKTHQVVHAVDDAILFVSRVVRWKRIKMVYEASRCFTGQYGKAPSWLWKMFPDHYHRLEKKVLKRSALVLSPCELLSADLRNVVKTVRLVQVEDIPVQPLFPRKEADRNALAGRFDGRTAFIVMCTISPGDQNVVRTLLLAARKVIEKAPQTGFFFKGLETEEALSIASSLDIQGRCVFIPASEPDVFIEVLNISDATLFVPWAGCRYMNPEILTLLNSPGLVVAIRDEAYATLLTERNCVEVIYTAASIAEGLLRVIQEPLLSIAIAAEGRQLIADRHTFSSFKHKIRLAYHEVLKRG